MDIICVLAVDLEDEPLPYFRGDDWLVVHVPDQLEAIVSFFQDDYPVLVVRRSDRSLVHWLRTHPSFGRLTVVCADTLEISPADEILAASDAQAA